MFKEICLEDQNVLVSPEGLNKLLNLVPDENIRSTLHIELDKKETSLERWNTFVSYIESCRVQVKL